ncbi:MAG: hypothetical protein IKG14_01320 [Clostridia bacterium]|nr:hypothetical protein [Clostridia bacterium]
MNWKEIYNKCNHKKYSIITNIEQPVMIKSNISNFLDKYKWYLLIGTIIIITALLITLKFNIKLIIGCLGIAVFLLISLIYYNTFKLIIKDDKLKINIMFKEITLKKDDLLTVYIERQKSRILLFIPFYFYSINILYNDKGSVAGYSLSTIMLKKKDVLNFFKHFEFNILKEQKEEDKKEQTYNNVIRIFTALAFIILIIAFLIFAYFSH